MRDDPHDKDEYNNFYRQMQSIPVSLSNNDYGDFHRAVVFNNYEEFAIKVVHYVMSI